MSVTYHGSFLNSWTTRAQESYFSEKLRGWYPFSGEPPPVAMEMPIVRLPGRSLRWAIPW